MVWPRRPAARAGLYRAPPLLDYTAMKANPQLIFLLLEDLVTML
jgi:hypothetical protein